MGDHVDVLIRKAVPEDAPELAELMNSAGEGIPAYLWSRVAEPGVQAMAVGARRAAQPDGTFSFKNAHVAVREEAVVGMLLGYVLPDPHDVGDLEEYPDVVRPLVALEALVAGSWYINALAVTDRSRGQGIGRRLMSLAEKLAELAAAHTLSLIVADENRIAFRLYENLGYRPRADRPMVPYPGSHGRGHWILMTKPTASDRTEAASDDS